MQLLQQRVFADFLGPVLWSGTQRSILSEAGLVTWVWFLWQAEAIRMNRGALVLQEVNRNHTNAIIEMHGA